MHAKPAGLCGGLICVNRAVTPRKDLRYAALYTAYNGLPVSFSTMSSTTRAAPSGPSSPR
jgi:hypothetical protein